MIPVVPAIVVSILLCALCYTVGYFDAVSRWNKSRKNLEAAIAELEEQVVAVNEQLAEDPQRASIDMGKRYVLNQLQTAIDHLRQEVQK